jgi:hypothetical protein
MWLLRFAHHISVQQYDAVLGVKVHALKICYGLSLLLNTCCTALVPGSVQGQNVYADPHMIARRQRVWKTLIAAEK